MGPLAGFLESYYRLRPVNATFSGVHDHDHRFPDWSKDGLDGTVREMRSLRNQLAPSPAPTTLAECDIALADAFLELQIAELEENHFVRSNPALWSGEAIFALVGLMIREFAPVATRADALAARIGALPAFLDAAAETLEGPAPALWHTRAHRECAAARRLLDRGLDQWMDSVDLPTSARTRLQAAVPDARRAFDKFASQVDHLEPEPSGGGCGADFYQRLLHRGHWCPTPTDTLLAEATRELDAARTTLSDLIRRQGYADWDAVQEAVASRHPSASRYLATFAELWQACRTAVEDHDLLTWPDFPLEYAPIPLWARDVAPDLYFLFYRSPAPFDATPAHCLVPPVDGLPRDEVAAVLRAVNTYVIKTNHVVHHGAIGHHVQNARAYRSGSTIGRIAAVDCASRIGMFCGGSLAEGWACYATDLMEEIGFLSDLERIAHQQGRIRQLVRAILDIRVHVDALPLADAVETFAHETGIPQSAAEREITRLSMFPGTSIMYWLGTRQIHDLRARMAARDGAAFTLRGFHDTFLDYGAMPVHLISNVMLGGTE